MLRGNHLPTKPYKSAPRPTLTTLLVFDPSMISNTALCRSLSEDPRIPRTRPADIAEVDVLMKLRPYVFLAVSGQVSVSAGGAVSRPPGC